MPKNAHPDSTFSSFLHNDWTQAQLSDDMNVQTKEIDNYAAWQSGHDSSNGEYDRTVPERFSEERDDTLMKSLI
jgi:hypothetical protein